jgi:hypothetical protein
MTPLTDPGQISNDDMSANSTPVINVLPNINLLSEGLIQTKSFSYPNKRRNRRSFGVPWSSIENDNFDSGVFDSFDNFNSSNQNAMNANLHKHLSRYLK